MSLVGNLEDLGLGEILQIVSLSRKSGILLLHSRGREGKIVFRLGQVIQATSSTCQESLGEVLIRKGKLDLAALRSALAHQEREGFRERLGTILVRDHGVPADAITEVVREQIERVVYALFAWAEGAFEFELQENVEAVDSIKMDPLQFMLDQGLNPQFLAMEGSRLVDEHRHRGGGIGEEALSREVVRAEAQPEDTVDAAFELLQAPSASAVIAGEGPLILVDDDGATRETLATCLERAGYQVSSFARSEDALVQLDSLYRRGERPVVLVDLIMPRMDGSGILGGLELLEMVWNNFPDLQILVMSDYHNGEAERRVSQLGYSHIIKPRRSQVGDSTLMEGFGSRLLAVLGGRESSGTRATPSGLINLGDELRLEMGEALDVTAVERVEPSTGMTHLRGMLEELNDPALGGGITLLALRFAAEFVSRAVIFTAMRDEIVGLGQFGIADRAESADARVRSLRVPRHDHSLFTGILEAKHPAVVRPDPVRWNQYLFDRLGDGVPDEVFLGPIVSEGRVVAILYGDNLPDRKPIAGTEALEIFLSQAGMVMEKALLERKLMESSRSGM
ncbi:MAG: response regulator [Desulfuromonadales bacterium]|nr:MAG: response regulator [Desulfuromonadales bacterium]